MFSNLYNEISQRALAFLGVFFALMLIGYGVLYFIDFIPEAKEVTEAEFDEVGTENVYESDLFEEVPMEVTPNLSVDFLPINITIDSLDRTTTVLNPSSRNIQDLDNALLKGVVRHPDSADLGDENGNILILGHSSYLNNVFNKNFQAFNGIQNLVWGDTIRLYSGDTEYIYQVERVYQDKASAITIPTKSTTPKLTLATCDTFGAKEDRFIVEATLVSKKPL